MGIERFSLKNKGKGLRLKGMERKDKRKVLSKKSLIISSAKTGYLKEHFTSKNGYF